MIPILLINIKSIHKLYFVNYENLRISEEIKDYRGSEIMWHKKWSMLFDISALVLTFIIALYLRFNFRIDSISKRWYLSTFIILLTIVLF